MLAQDVAISIHEIALRQVAAIPSEEGFVIIAIFDKADFLTVLIFRIFQCFFPCDLPHSFLVLRIIEGQDETRDHVFSQTIEHIGLIFCLVLCTSNEPLLALRILIRPCVVTRGDPVSTFFICRRKQRLELYIRIADDARIRRSAADVFAAKIPYDLFPENIADIPVQEFDPQLLRRHLCTHRTGIFSALSHSVKI